MMEEDGVWAVLSIVISIYCLKLNHYTFSAILCATVAMCMMASLQENTSSPTTSLSPSTSPSITSHTTSAKVVGIEKDGDSHPSHSRESRLYEARVRDAVMNGMRL